jgi:hypothetical protein
MGTFILTGLILGLTSNFHCIGMCGPIAMAVPVNRSSNLKILSGTLQYNGGRIITYTILGAIVGSIGLTINTMGVLQWLSIIAGIGLILYAWRKYFSNLFSGKLPTFGIQSFLNKGLGKVIKSNSPFKLVLLGGLNGLLPCGMVFAALLNAILTGEILGSALAMAAFGIGTLPAMMAVTFMANKINSNVRQKMNKAVPYLLTIVGILVVLRGMNLNIPFISPNTTVVEQVDMETGETETQVEMSCCHKPE